MRFSRSSKAFLLAIAVLVIPHVGRAAIDGDFLISACQDLVGIYDRRGKERFLAGISTSVAEAMRAGICRGMLEEHARQSLRCFAGWYQQALYISSLDTDQEDVELILDRACAKTNAR